MINLLNRKTIIEKNLCGTTKIFGEVFTIEVMYNKIVNPELNLCGKRIVINLPNRYKKIGNFDIIKVALEKMYDEIARIEIENAMEETRIMLNGLAPENFEIKRISNKLAKTLKNGTIIINPDIVKYNKDVLRYVLLFEFCHLKYKTPCKKFWNMIEKYMPYYEKYESITNAA